MADCTDNSSVRSAGIREQEAALAMAGSAGREYANAKKEMVAAVAQIERRVVQGGEMYRSLHMQIQTAHTYLTGRTIEDGNKEGWEALRSLLACDDPKPDWPLPGGMTDKETKDMSWNALTKA